MQSRSPDTESDDDSPLEPAQMLALLEDQRRSVQRRLAAFVPYILLAWGSAWGIGFGALWLIDGAEPAFSLPFGAAIGIFAVSMLLAIAISAVLGVRSSRGVRSSPAAAFTGVAYGLTWSVGLIAIVLFGIGLRVNGMSDGLIGIFYPTAYTLMVGLMYMVAGGIWRGVPALVVGAWLVVVSATGPFFGYPTHYLVFALAGGGAFLVLAAVTFVSTRGKTPPGRPTPHG